ncbi:MAG: hypothetical protein U5N58_01640 [Actinomycetota bacterium]|nr:hypothetical protein [Actinomycetota bacterium]
MKTADYRLGRYGVREPIAPAIGDESSQYFEENIFFPLNINMCAIIDFSDEILRVSLVFDIVSLFFKSFLAI